MKRAFVLLVASAGILASCSGLNETDFEEKTNFEDGELVERVIFEAPEIRALGDDNETRASLSQDGEGSINFAWEATDTVGIYPNKGAQAYFEMSEGVGTNVAFFDGGGWSLRNGATYSCYFPFVGDMYLKRNAIPVSFANQEQTGVSNHDGVRFFLASEGTSSSSGTLRFTFQMLNTVIRIKAIGLPAGTYTKLSLTTDEDLFVQDGVFGLDDMSITGKTYSNTLEISLKDFTLTEASTEANPVLVYMTSAPVDLSGKTVTVQVYSDDDIVYECVKEPTKAYDAGAWGGLKCEMEAVDTSVNYAKASSITVGGTYLIVDADDTRLFMGAKDGSFVNVSPENSVITDTDGTLAAYEFTVENSGNNYYLVFNDGKYLVCDYGNNGDGTSGLRYVDSRGQVTYPYALTTGNNGAFFFSTTQMTSTGNVDQVLYFKTGSGSGTNIFKIGGSGRTIGVHLYMKNGKQDRGLSFNPQSVTCTLDGIPEKPALSGTYTTITYTSSDNSIATVDAEGNVTPCASGIVTISAHADEDDQYSAGTATYTLYIKFNSTSKKYVRVTSADQINLDGEYVIVYENDLTQKAFKPILNAGRNAFLTSTNNAIDATIIDNEIEADKVDDCRITLANQDGTSKKFSLIVPEADGITDYYWYVYRSSVFAAKALPGDSSDTGYRSTFTLSPDNVLTITGTNSYAFQYSSSGYFTAGTGSSSNLYLFIRADGPVKQKQTLSFAEPTITWPLGDDYILENSYDFPQQVTGAQTTITYTCEPESVAKIEGGRIKIIGAGSATVTATAEKNDQYYAANASYTLRITKPAPEGWVDMETFNLENRALYDYLYDAVNSYSDTDDATNSVMETYATGSDYASIDRKDCPNPVTIAWTNSASASTVISIFENDTLTNPVWTQNATEKATSADVYNLIPGRTYYYTVSENGSIWEKGYFNTTGRRRMIKVSDIERTGHANNCRDLGGLEVMDKGTKKTIKYGYIFRGTNMDKTTDTEKALLTGFLNIGMDVDLRSGNASSSGQTENGNSVCYRPLTVGYINPGFNSFNDLTTVDKIKSVITAIINTALSDKASYFHCYIGADRTGYIGMMIEGLLGVSEKDCSIDYELTSFSEAAELRYRTGKPRDYYFRQGIAFLRGQTGDTFQDKIENYLVNTVGISQADINEFKSKVLE